MFTSLGRKLTAAPRSPVLPMATLRRGGDDAKAARALASRSGRAVAPPATDKVSTADQQRAAERDAVGARAALKRVWRAYLDSLASRPVATKAVTCFVGECERVCVCVRVSEKGGQGRAAFEGRRKTLRASPIPQALSFRPSCPPTLPPLGGGWRVSSPPLPLSDPIPHQPTTHRRRPRRRARANHHRPPV